jgi:hypothetical protein
LDTDGAHREGIDVKAIRVIVGLVYDDPWLFGGTLVALLVAKFLLVIGVAGVAVGGLLALLLFAAILVSIAREVRAKKV